MKALNFKNILIACCFLFLSILAMTPSQAGIYIGIGTGYYGGSQVVWVPGYWSGPYWVPGHYEEYYGYYTEPGVGLGFYGGGGGAGFYYYGGHHHHHYH